MKWTTEQLEAITKTGSNIIVSAGAGSGKTAVLSERVLDHLNKGMDIREILILTFTNEAALEMAQRIRKKIKNAKMKEQLEYLNSAYITTFDAYSLSVVKKYHTNLNIGRDIKIIESSIIELEKKDIVVDIMKKLYDTKDSNFLKLIKDFTNYDDEVIVDMILNLNNSLNLAYDVDNYLDSYIDKYYSDIYIDKVFNEYFNYIKDMCINLENLVYQLESYMDSDNYIKIYDVCSKYFKPNNYDSLYKYNDIRLPSFRKLDEEGIHLKEEIKNVFNNIKSLIEYSKSDLINNYLSTKDYVDVIIRINKELNERIMIYKKNNNSYEFGDIAKMAIDLVKYNKSIREEIRDSFKEIMIDEYQDTSDLQETFINLIENNNVYMVGDIKQSIYRFRNANPLIFKNKYEKYSKFEDGIKIDLVKNFRSRFEVLDDINKIFNLIMTKDIGGVDYGSNHAMVYGNKAYIENGSSKQNNNLEIYKYPNDIKKYSNDEIEAFIIAKDILMKLENNYQVYDFDLGTLRNATWRDFAIILDRGTAMDLYKKIFEYFHIPLDLYKDSNLMNEDDIYILKNIIGLIFQIKDKIIDKKTKYYFTSIARSYVGNLSDEEIYDINMNGIIYNTDIYKKCFELGKDIHLKTASFLIKEIIDKFDFYEHLILVGNVDNGIKRFRYLINLTSNMENLGLTIKDLFLYLEKLVKDNKEIRFKENHGSSDAVKIMNIHKSKGLEFPICYFAGFPKKFNIRDMQNSFMFDNEYGIITPYFNEGIGDIFIKSLVKNNYIKEEIAEKIRLFYVALTRAKEKMIMVMPEFKENKKVDGTIFFDEALKYRSFYNFINSISINLESNMKSIKELDIGLTKDYEFNSVLKKNIGSINEVIDIVNINVDSKVINKGNASKNIDKVLKRSDINKLKYGTKLHEELEYTNLYKVNNNKIVSNLHNIFNFDDAIIYQELEFVFLENLEYYNGVIDLLLEYDDKFIIVDYKLKNISDLEYKKQLNVYYRYIKSISNKKVLVYLYSIMDDKIEEISI